MTRRRRSGAQRPAAAYERRPLRSSRILAQRAEQATVLLSLDEGTYFSLNEVGGRIWELCDGARTIEEMIDAVHAEFDAPREQIAADVVALVDELASERLLVDRG